MGRKGDFWRGVFFPPFLFGEEWRERRGCDGSISYNEGSLCLVTVWFGAGTIDWDGAGGCIVSVSTIVLWYSKVEFSIPSGILKVDFFAGGGGGGKEGLLVTLTVTVT